MTRETGRADGRTRAASGGYPRGARYGGRTAEEITELPGEFALLWDTRVRGFLASGDPVWELRVPEGQAVIISEGEPGGLPAFLLPGTRGAEPDQRGS